MAAKNSKNIVACLTWVRKGCAKQKPDKVSLDRDELQKIITDAKEKLHNDEILDDEVEEEEEEEVAANEDDEVASAVLKAQQIAADIFKKSNKRKLQEKNDEDENDIINKYGMDEYDDDENATDFMHGIGTLAEFASNEEDPYITLKEELDSDDEDFMLKPSDNLLALGKVTEEAAILEVHVYNGELSNLFIHHDYVLPTFPLVLEWLDYDVADGEKGNFVAMGTMEPDIGIWDLDVVASLEPVAVLAGVKEEGKTKKKKTKKKDISTSGHSDAVLDLSWNSNVRNVLASASADTTVCLWDLNECKVVSTLSHHQMQVQCLSWHPVEAQSLLSGSFDHTTAVVDCRSPAESIKVWKLQGEVERVVWNHFNPFQFLASTDQGMLYGVDIRQDKPLFTLSAHDQAITGMSISSQIPGLVVTASEDKHIKVWDINDGKPSLVLSRDLHLDVMHCVMCNPDHPFVYAFGGNKDFKVWDIRESAAVRRHFFDRMPAPLAAECEGDTEDITEKSTTEAMANLNVSDEEDAREQEEYLGGDRPTKPENGDARNTGKKKRKRKKTSVS